MIQCTGESTQLWKLSLQNVHKKNGVIHFSMKDLRKSQKSKTLFTSNADAPFGAVAGDDVNRLKPERIRGAKRSRNVSEIAQPFDHQADGVAPIPHRVPKPLLPGLQYMGAQRLQKLAAAQVRPPTALEPVEVREPLAGTLAYGRTLPVGNARPAFHLHQRCDVVCVREQVRHRVLLMVLR